jgi:sigma-B regulation protein RsbU (phosphoserine phosphatase)
MKILIAEDDLTSRQVLEAMLKKWEYEVVVAANGQQAWEAMQEEDPPQLAILDWIMPGMDGLELCRKIRETPALVATYVILLTAKRDKDFVVVGLDGGANDYIPKPFDPKELHARVRVGKRVVTLQNELTKRVRELQDALAHIKTLQGLLPICSYCKKIRDDRNYWQQLESYISERSGVSFSHGICPDCFEIHIRPQLKPR